MHENICGKSDKNVSPELDVAALLVYALEWERHRREGAGRVYRYGSITVCERCLKDYILDYAALSLERESEYRCELCGESAPLLFHLSIVDSLRKRLEEVRQLNWSGR
ncbi:MAG: hypothetical protein QXN24_04885 [Candidatus Bathyarchaeia archaeon]